MGSEKSNIVDRNIKDALTAVQSIEKKLKKIENRRSHKEGKDEVIQALSSCEYLFARLRVISENL